MEIRLPKALVLPVNAADPSRTGHVRRQAAALGSSLDFTEVEQGEFAIIVTEAAANIAAHGGEGEILLIPWRFSNTVGVDVLAIDKGQGMPDIGRALEDGYSTGGTAGEGLGAISRLASTLQIYSAPGHGTVLFARVVSGKPTTEISDDPPLGSISVAVAGETECGDAWAADYTRNRSLYLVADGLGHGPLAAEAAREAVRVFHEAPHLAPERILADIHHALVKTRGAAVSIAEISHDEAVVNFAGVGNVAGAILDGGKTRSMVSMNGTLGHTIGRVQAFRYPWSKNSTLLMHSDGLASRWNLDQYSGLASRHPALIAGVLYRDFSRKRDDVTILVSRIQGND